MTKHGTRPATIIFVLLLLALLLLGAYFLQSPSSFHALTSSSSSSSSKSDKEISEIEVLKNAFDSLSNSIAFMREEHTQHLKNLEASFSTLTKKIEEAPAAPPADPAVPAGERKIGETSGPDEASHHVREDAFTDIYRKNKWNSGESKSGPGSEIKITGNIRELLAVTFKIFGIKRFLDSPCGDCNWQWNITGLETMSYTGIDVVPDVIIADAKRHFHRPWMKFVNIDLAAENLPKDQFEVILCRDMLQHLPLDAGIKAIENFEQSGAKYLVTNFHSLNYLQASGGNKVIQPGDFYLIDPMVAPFNFPPPLYYRVEHADSAVQGVQSFKNVGVWKLPVLGKGSGTSILPINPKAHELIVALDPEAAAKLKEAGVVVLDDSAALKR